MCGSLAPYEYPREIEFIDALPMTTTGKVQRRVLRERERDRKMRMANARMALRPPLRSCPNRLRSAARRRNPIPMWRPRRMVVDHATGRAVGLCAESACRGTAQAAAGAQLRVAVPAAARSDGHPRERDRTARGRAISVFALATMTRIRPIPAGATHAGDDALERAGTASAAPAISKF